MGLAYLGTFQCAVEADKHRISFPIQLERTLLGRNVSSDIDDTTLIAVPLREEGYPFISVWDARYRQLPRKQIFVSEYPNETLVVNRSRGRRIRLPGGILSYLNFPNKVDLVGVMNTFEIWDSRDNALRDKKIDAGKFVIATQILGI